MCQDQTFGKHHSKSGHHRPCNLSFGSSTTVVKKNCPMVNMSKSARGHNKVKQVKQSQKHVENKINT